MPVRIEAAVKATLRLDLGAGVFVFAEQFFAIEFELHGGNFSWRGRYHSPVFSIEAQGSSAGRRPPF